MGSAFSRGGATPTNDEEAQRAAQARRGLYFGPHFVMSGDRFATDRPTEFVFGGMTNEPGTLTGLGLSRLPSQTTAELHRTTTIRSFVNVKKSSVRLVRVASEDGAASRSLYKLCFTVDADAECTVRVYYAATEGIDADGNPQYKSRHRGLCPLPRVFPKRLGQKYELDKAFLFDPAAFPPADMLVDDERHVQGVYPIVIHAEATPTEEDQGIAGPDADAPAEPSLIDAPVEPPSAAHRDPLQRRVQSQSTFATLVAHSDGTYGLRVLKQKISVDGVAYMLQEIYGIDQAPDVDGGANGVDDDGVENTRECVVCMSDTKDTMVLPCRHLCLCSACAEQLRFQSTKCPICRQPFHALLQIRMGEPSGEREPEMEQIIAHDPLTAEDDNSENAAVVDMSTDVIAAAMSAETTNAANAAAASAGAGAAAPPVQLVSASLVYSDSRQPVKRSEFAFPRTSFGQVTTVPLKSGEDDVNDDDERREADEADATAGRAQIDEAASDDALTDDELSKPAAQEGVDPLTAAAMEREAAEARRLRRQRRKERQAAREAKQKEREAKRKEKEERAARRLAKADAHTDTDAPAIVAPAAAAAAAAAATSTAEAMRKKKSPRIAALEASPRLGTVESFSADAFSAEAFGCASTDRSADSLLASSSGSVVGSTEQLLLPSAPTHDVSPRRTANAPSSNRKPKEQSRADAEHNGAAHDAERKKKKKKAPAPAE